MLFDGFAHAVHFEQQHGGAIERKSRVDVGFDGAERPAVEHFAGGGSDAARGDVHDGFGGVVDVSKIASSVFTASGKRVSFTVISVTSASVPSEPTNRPRQVVAGRIERGAADTDEFAGRQNDFEREHVIGGDAVSERVRAAGIFRDVAADGAGFLAGRVGREMQPGVRDGGAQIRIHDARLNHGALIFDVNFQDAIHARKNDEDAAFARESAPPERPVPAPRPTSGV